MVEGTVEDLYFMHTRPMIVGGTPCRVTRCGYTGEDGFEISVPLGKVSNHPEVLVGLHVLRYLDVLCTKCLTVQAVCDFYSFVTIGIHFLDC